MQRIARISTLLVSAALTLGAGPAQAAGNPAAGQQKSQTCAACHGPQGKSSQQPNYPILAGQHESYLYQALKGYKSGARQNAVMNGMVSQLSDQDLQDLAAWFASQEHLYTVPLDRDAAAE